MVDDKRVIEDYLPITSISAVASRMKSVQKGRIASMHLWWARRPAVACRAAIFGALVRADWPVTHSEDRNERGPRGGSTNESEPSGTTTVPARATSATFIKTLCSDPVSVRVLETAKRLIEDAHRQAEPDLGENHTGDTPRKEPRVLDMFAGGGGIPLEALRLGCKASALDLNPVAHIIELCTLVFPQEYGPSSARSVGSDSRGQWQGLGKEVRHWGNWVRDRVHHEIGDLYPPIPNPRLPPKVTLGSPNSKDKPVSGSGRTLTPVMYLWTRTVLCKNPKCAATIPLVKQTWLCKSRDRYVALRHSPNHAQKRVFFKVVEAKTMEGLGFDPSQGAAESTVACPFCGTVADDRYVRAEGLAKRTGTEFLGLVCVQPGHTGKLYFSPQDLPVDFTPDLKAAAARVALLEEQVGLQAPREKINPLRPSPNARGLSAVTRHGLTTFRELFNSRQELALLSFANAIRAACNEMSRLGYDEERRKAVAAYLALILDRLADFNSVLCVHNYIGSSRIAHTFGRHALAMTGDYVEANPFHEGSGGWGTEAVCDVIGSWDCKVGFPAEVVRGSATNLPWEASSFDAIITDPPFYDSVPYADVSDFFYVWMKRAIGPLFPIHFATELTPKKSEITAFASHHNGDMAAANASYEALMEGALREAHRVLKPGAPLVVVYAHKTTLGWSTLINALRGAGFVVTEAWPLETEKPGRLASQGSASLTSSIFLVARKRGATGIGRYEIQVRPNLEALVRERVDTLWDMGLSGADLVIACVGAGLRAFTHFESVEYANGDHVPAEAFLAEVETVVLEFIFERLSRDAGSAAGGPSLAGVDAPTRFYLLWRCAYGSRDLTAGEAIVFANGTHVELGGSGGLSLGPHPLVTRSTQRSKESSFHLLDHVVRGQKSALGEDSPGSSPPPIIDVLQRILWLAENDPRALPLFLKQSRANRDLIKLVAQALAGTSLAGSGTKARTTLQESSAIGRLLANWRSIVEEADMVIEQGEGVRHVQKTLDSSPGEP